MYVTQYTVQSSNYYWSYTLRVRMHTLQHNWFGKKQDVSYTVVTSSKESCFFFSGLGYKSTSIVRLLKDEGLTISRSAVVRFVKKYMYKEKETICRRPGSSHPLKITPEVLRFVEDQMTLDDETTIVQLQKLLFDNQQPLSLKPILRSRSKLGWTFPGSAYCQLI